MPALNPTPYAGTIVWLGTVDDRDAALASDGASELTLTFAGPTGEAHGGLTRPSCSRVTAQYPKGTEIRNTRQLSIVSEEELSAIAAEIGIERLDPGLIGATMMVSGLPDFSHVPPSSRLQAPSGATVTVDLENRPCTLPHPVIDAAYPGFGKGFKAAAKGRRGVTAWVEREGPMRVGDTLTLHVPDQPAWQPG